MDSLVNIQCFHSVGRWSCCVTSWMSREHTCSCFLHCCWISTATLSGFSLDRILACLNCHPLAHFSWVGPLYSWIRVISQYSAGEQQLPLVKQPYCQQPAPSGEGGRFVVTQYSPLALPIHGYVNYLLNSINDLNHIIFVGTTIVLHARCMPDSRDHYAASQILLNRIYYCVINNVDLYMYYGFVIICMLYIIKLCSPECPLWPRKLCN
jgi:hypothetical protein